jgi:hypothetical protein
MPWLLSRRVVHAFELRCVQLLYILNDHVNTHSASTDSALLVAMLLLFGSLLQAWLCLTQCVTSGLM